jgi:hypothetical protein
MNIATRKTLPVTLAPPESKITPTPGGCGTAPDEGEHDHAEDLEDDARCG